MRLTIDQDRLKRELDDLGAISAEPAPVVTRVVFTDADLRALDLLPMAEFQLTSDTIRLFRTGYVAAFGAADPDALDIFAVGEHLAAVAGEHVEHQLAGFLVGAGGDVVRLDEPRAESNAQAALHPHPPLTGNPQGSILVV